MHPLLRSVIVSAYGDMVNIRTALNRGAFEGQQTAATPMESIVNAVIARVNTFADGAPASGDMTFLGIRYLGKD